jgi:hypothetical protein
MLELNREAAARNLTIVSGGAGTVGVGGYLTGGGHAALSSTYGLAADQVLEIEMVTPNGKVVTANECQHRDLFWAMRGVSFSSRVKPSSVLALADTKTQGGGSTFGIITSITIRAFPSTPFAVVTALLGTMPLPGSDPFWDATTTMLSHFASLDSQGISAYTFVAPGFTSASMNITSPINAFYGIFMLPLLFPGNTSDSLSDVVKAVFDAATAPFPPLTFFSSVSARTYPSFWDWYKDANGPLDAGSDVILGSRLLDQKALTGDGNASLVKATLKTLTAGSSKPLMLYLVAGKGVRNARPRDGGNSVNPAWRRALVHAGMFCLRRPTSRRAVLGGAVVLARMALTRK